MKNMREKLPHFYFCRISFLDAKRVAAKSVCKFRSVHEFFQKITKQTKSEILLYDLCTTCLKPCEYNNQLKVIFFPNEVEKGLHEIFPYKKITINGHEVYYFEGMCPYFSDGICRLYATEYMPLDCQLYPITPISKKEYLIDENCVFKEKIRQNKDYIKRCLKKISKTPKEFLKIYSEL